MNDESAARRLISHQPLYGSSIIETARYLFTSTAFLSKIRKLYRERGDVSQNRCVRQIILSGLYTALKLVVRSVILEKYSLMCYLADANTL